MDISNQRLMPFYFSASRIIRHSDEVRLGRKAMCIADIVSDPVYTKKWPQIIAWPFVMSFSALSSRSMR